MSKRKAKFAAWVIMLLAGGLMVFIFRGSRTVFTILAGLLAAYGYVSAGDDLIRYLQLPEGGGHNRKKARG